jgi:hypothetical protein
MATPRSAADEIKQLYYAATKASIAKDLERAITLLISLESDQAREDVAVYMDGLSQMRSEWAAAGKAATTAKVAPPAKTRQR